jgi:aromatic-L-amino-acid/L-tryptophan decarboxylase
MNERADIVAKTNDLITAVFEKRKSERPLPSNLDPHQLRKRLAGELPKKGSPAIDVLCVIEKEIIPTVLNLANPMTFGLMTPHPLPLPARLDGLISALNQNLGCAWRTAPSAIEIELLTIRWLCQLCELPPGSGGHFTSGGTISNLTGIRLALHRGYPEARIRGLLAIQRQPVIYVSDQGHFSIDRAASILGLGEQQVRKVPALPDLTMNTKRLLDCIRADRRAGLAPLAVVGTAGTTANGTIDPLAKLAQICTEENLWFHVDAAYGGALALSERYRTHLKGLEQADSITLDPHKWMFMPFSLGALLTRHPQLLRNAFGQETAYLGQDHIPEQGGTPTGFYEVSLLASRRFDGLKLWAALKHLGVDGFSEIIERQIALAQSLYECLSEVSGIEVAPRSPTNIICFRWAPADRSEKELDELQNRFQQQLEESAGCWLSSATIRGRRFVRVNLLHYDLNTGHIDRLLQAILAAKETCDVNAG